MDDYFEKFVKDLKNNIQKEINNGFLYCKHTISKELEKQFFSITDKVSLSLLEDKDDFYGYFLFQMGREINFNLSAPTGVNFKNAKYYIYFNPLMFLDLTLNQMKTSIKHEIHHIIAYHLIRANELKDKYSPLAINLAMDVAANEYLDNDLPYSITLKYVNNKYKLKLKPFNTFEYYLEGIQNEIDLLEEDKKGDISSENNINDSDKLNDREEITEEFDPLKAHEIWNQGSEVNENTLIDFTLKYINDSKKGVVPKYVQNMISSLEKLKGYLPWNLYLKKLIGSVYKGKKKTSTRLSRRQPSRLDIRGEIANYKPKVYVAIDISGSISSGEFKQAILEVLSIVRNYNNEIIIIECDKEIERVYAARSIKDIKERAASSGGTRFSPVFDYSNKNKIDFLVYFTDGLGEKKLEVIPRGYKVLWVITEAKDELSLQNPYGAIKRLKEIDVLEDIDLKDIKTDGYSMNSQEPIF